MGNFTRVLHLKCNLAISSNLWSSMWVWIKAAWRELSVHQSNEQSKEVILYLHTKMKKVHIKFLHSLFTQITTSETPRSQNRPSGQFTTLTFLCFQRYNQANWPQQQTISGQFTTLTFLCFQGYNQANWPQQQIIEVTDI